MAILFILNPAKSVRPARVCAVQRCNESVQAASTDSVAAGWPANSVAVNFAAAANFVVVDSVIATSGAAASEIATSGAAASDSASVTTMATTPPVTRMDMGTGMDMAVAIPRTPPAMRTTKTTAVAL